eukprot:613854-Pleurochrysis_carterae.AAC.3
MEFDRSSLQFHRATSLLLTIRAMRAKATHACQREWPGGAKRVQASMKVRKRSRTCACARAHQCISPLGVRRKATLLLTLAWKR